MWQGCGSGGPTGSGALTGRGKDGGSVGEDATRAGVPVTAAAADGSHAGAGAGISGARRPGNLWVRTRAVPAVPAVEPPGDEEEAPAVGMRAGGRDAPGGGNGGGAEGGRRSEGGAETDQVAQATPGVVRWGERLLLELPSGAEKGTVAVEVRASNPVYSPQHRVSVSECAAWRRDGCGHWDLRVV